VDRFAKLELFTCNDMLFKGAEQEVLLVLATGKLPVPSKSHVCRIELTEAESMTALVSSKPSTRPNGKVKTVNHDSEKWLKYFLTAPEIAFMRALREGATVSPLNRHATIDVGWSLDGMNSSWCRVRRSASSRSKNMLCPSSGVPPS
jgi:hypothetical protein